MKNVWLMRQFLSEYSIAEFLERAVQEMRRHGHLFLERAVQEKAGEEFVSRFVRERKGKLPSARQLRAAVRSVLPEGNGEGVRK